MTSAVEAVDLYLQRDPTLADAVSRGLANIRKTARWMIEENGWDVTEDAVVSALRRYNDRNPQQPLVEARRSLPQGRVELRTDLALLQVPRTHDIQKDALQAWKVSDVRDTLGVLPSRTTLKILIEKPSMQSFCGELGRERVEDIVSPVSAVQVKFDGRAPDFTVSALLVSALAHRGIEVVELMSCAPAYSVVVQAEDGKRTFDALSEVTT